MNLADRGPAASHISIMPMVDVWRQPDAHTYDSELTVVVNSIVLVSVESDSSLIGVEGGSWELNKAILIFARSFR